MGLLSTLGGIAGSFFGGPTGASVGSALGGALEDDDEGGTAPGGQYVPPAPADFDGGAYLRAYLDVARDPYFASRPWAHYYLHGQSEGRTYPSRESSSLRSMISSQLVPDYGPLQLTGASAMPVAFPAISSLGRAGMAGLSRLLPGVGGAVSAVAGAVRSVGGRILHFILPSGQKVTRRAAVNLAKSIGLQAAAAALGVGAVEVAEAIMQEEGKTKRGRGITAAQIRITTRTIGKLERAHARIARAARTHINRRK